MTTERVAYGPRRAPDLGGDVGDGAADVELDAQPLAVVGQTTARHERITMPIGTRLNEASALPDTISRSGAAVRVP